MHHLIRKSLLAGLTLSAAVMATSASAAKVNPYNYNVYKNAINDAKWQRGSNSEQQCSQTGCQSTLNSSTSKKYIWANDANGQMQFSTDGSKAKGWRSELRFLANFSRGSNRTMTAKMGYWKNLSTSDGFTIAQLHMDKNTGYTVKGPPARLEIVDESHFEVKFRRSHDCTSSSSPDCWPDDVGGEYSTSISNWKDVQLHLSGDVINVSVAGQTYSYNLKSAPNTDWPSNGGYYWKTGVYMQDAGSAYIGYKNLYW